MKRISGDKRKTVQSIPLDRILHSIVVHMEEGKDLWATVDPNDFYSAFAEWFDLLEGFQMALVETCKQYEVMTTIMRVCMPPEYEIVKVNNPYYKKESEEALPMDELPPDDVVGDIPF